MGKMYINSTIIYNKMNWFELENNKKVETRNYNGIGVKRQGKKKKRVFEQHWKPKPYHFMIAGI